MYDDWSPGIQSRKTASETYEQRSIWLNYSRQWFLYRYRNAAGRVVRYEFRPGERTPPVTFTTWPAMLTYFCEMIQRDPLPWMGFGLTGYLELSLVPFLRAPHHVLPVYPKPKKTRKRRGK